MVMSLKPKAKPEEAPKNSEQSQANSPSGITLESVPRMFCAKCGQKIDTSIVKALSIGHCPACGENIFVEGKVGPYRILKLIGQGGMGAVYEGFDNGLGRKVAVKVTLVDVTRDPKMLETFQREAQAVAKLNHPNVVQVYAFGEEHGHPYLAMELLPSGSLMDRMAEEEPIAVPFLMGVAFSITEGLSAALEAGLLHGDIKPENILFDDKMHAKLVDFGIAAMNVANGGGGEVWGTPYYIAPEKVLEQKATHKCDIYSLGATLYHVLAKRPPFEGVDGTTVIKAAIDGTADPLSALRPDLPPEVEAIISRMMEKDASRRYPNYKSLLSDIKKYLATVPHESLRRTSRIVTGGTRKISSGTRKIVVQGAVPKSPGMTANMMAGEAESVPSKKRSKLPLVIAAAAVVVALGVGGGIYRAVKSGKTQKGLYASAQKLEGQYARVYAVILESHEKVGKLLDESQSLCERVTAQRGASDKGGEPPKETLENILSQAKQLQTLWQEVEVLRNTAEQSKPEPLPQDGVDAEQLDLLKKEVTLQVESAKTLKAKAEEAEGLLAGMKSKWAAFEKETKKVAATTQKPPAPKQDVVTKSADPAQRPLGKDELAKGFGRAATAVDLAQQPGLKEFKLNDGESLIVAVWNPNADELGGGVLKKIQVARKGGDTAEFKGEPFETPLGAFALRGVGPWEKFPAVSKTVEAEPATKRGEYGVPTVKTIQFVATSDAGLYLASSGPLPSGTKEGWAPALVFTAKQNGFYSLSGALVLQAKKPQTTLSWMAWVSKPKAK